MTFLGAAGRRRGLNAQIKARQLARARELGHRQVIVSVADGNTAALHAARTRLPGVTFAPVREVRRGRWAWVGRVSC